MTVLRMVSYSGRVGEVGGGVGDRGCLDPP